MGEQLPAEGLPAQLKEARLLADVDQLLACRHADGSYDPADDQAMLTNYDTAIAEMSMPFAVTTTLQRAEYLVDEDGREHRLFRWLGDCAVQVAESGYLFHESEAAQARVEVEIDEAWHSESHCRPGTAQPFISPRMSATDAPKHVAEAEHLDADDQLRVATAVTDAGGRVIGRKLESLLVRDIPLDAWVSMLQDPNNIFGRAFDVRDPSSAVSVMELFDQMALPEECLPEGPVSLIAAVLPYITDVMAQASVEVQLDKFRGDQELYRRTARQKAEEWLQFDKELAESLHTGWATTEVRRLIATLQHQWGDEDLACINGHSFGDGYMMSRELAARLEQAKQNVLANVAAIATGNEEVLAQMDHRTGQKLKDDIAILEMAKAEGASEAEIRQMEAQLQRNVARQNLTVGGGCPGKNEGKFRDDKPDGLLDGAGGENDEEDGDRTKWKWKRGRCRVETCSTRPGETVVGPCDVCIKCQHVFDAGGDPTKGGGGGASVTAGTEAAPTVTASIDGLLQELSREFSAELDKRREKAKRKAGEFALAG